MATNRMFVIWFSAYALQPRNTGLAACIFNWLLGFGGHNRYEESNCYCDNVFH